MHRDVEEQLGALGRVWDEAITEVDPSEIVSGGKGRRNHPAVDIALLEALPPPPPRGTHALTEEETTMIELDTSSRTESHRKRPVLLLAAAVLVAAALIGVALVALRDDATSPADQLATAAPLFASPYGSLLAPGTYAVDMVDGAAVTPFLVTVGEGWSTYEGWALTKGDGQIITLSRPGRVPLDACQPDAGDHPGPLTTVAGLLAALHSQAGWVDVTDPVDRSVDGRTGKAFDRAVPADICGCAPEFTGWAGPWGGTSYYPARDRETVWVLDLDGTPVVIETRLNTGQPPEAAAEMADILDSVRIAG
jgi:hypothetical protein